MESTFHSKTFRWLSPSRDWYRGCRDFRLCRSFQFGLSGLSSLFVEKWGEDKRADWIIHCSLNARRDISTGKSIILTVLSEQVSLDRYSTWAITINCSWHSWKPLVAKSSRAVLGKLLSTIQFYASRFFVLAESLSTRTSNKWWKFPHRVGKMRDWWDKLLLFGLIMLSSRFSWWSERARSIVSTRWKIAFRFPFQEEKPFVWKLFSLWYQLPGDGGKFIPTSRAGVNLAICELSRDSRDRRAKLSPLAKQRSHDCATSVIIAIGNHFSNSRSSIFHSWHKSFCRCGRIDRQTD